MGNMNIVLNDKLEKRFRNAVFEKKGMKKDNSSEAGEEAIDAWIELEAQKPAKGGKK